MHHRILTLLILTFSGLCACALTPEEVKEHTSKAESGDDYSQLLLMSHYNKNKDYRASDKWALKLYENTSASEKRKGTACQYLGVNAWNGSGRAVSVDEAQMWWKRGTQLGDEYSARLLAEIHNDNRMPNRLDREEAWKWYVKGADLGDNHCCRIVAKQYDEAPASDCVNRPDSIFPDVTRNIVLSTKYWEKFLSTRESYPPADGGSLGYYHKSYPDIEYRLANRYFSGEEGVTQDFEKAVNHYMTAIYSTENPVNNAPEARPLTDEELGEAMWRISICYRFGRGVVQNELTAHKWTRRAAAKGHPHAQKLMNQN